MWRDVSSELKFENTNPFFFCKVTRYPDDNQRVYKTIPMKFPKGWRGDLNYSARTKDGRVKILKSYFATPFTV